MRLRFLTSLPVLICLAHSVYAAPVRDDRVEAELISEVLSVQPGQPFTVGLRLTHDPHWHTYWKASTTGYANSLAWDLPPGFSAGDLHWPVPTTYEMGGLVEFVYNDTVVLPVTITPPANLEANTTVTLRARAEWLMCEDVCIPGGVDLSLTLPVQTGAPAIDPAHTNLFATAFDQLPMAPASIEAAAWRKGSDVFIALNPLEGTIPPQLYFYDSQRFLEPALTHQQQRNPDGTVLMEFKVDPAGAGEVDRLRGVLATLDGSWSSTRLRPGIELDLVWSDGPPNFLGDIDQMATQAAPRGLLALIGLAFVGGLILNLMPCVFPVIGIKIMGFVNQAGEERRKVIQHGLTFTVGVLLSFWVLAGSLLILRSGGEQLGWGFQLQDPVFVFLLTLFLFAFALNMSGIFEFGTSVMGVGSGLSAKSGLTGSFFSGVLATVVATPCAAPFLAPALGAALALPPISSLIVFTAIALGLSTPYLVLSAIPSLTRFLPRPGAWMETFKQFLAFLLYATAGVLLWVMVGQLVDAQGYTPFALLNVIFSLVIIAMAAWVYGRWAAPFRNKTVRRFAQAATALLVLAALVLGYPTPLSDIKWEHWEPGKAEQLAADGNLVYVDFTARWCVTCQTNKATVFQSDEVKRFFKDHQVIALKADWTNRDATIAAALAAFDRSAVPFNLIYSPGRETPVLLPEILTPGAVLQGFEEAKGK